MPNLSRHASVNVDLSPEVAFQVITDYDAYGEWMPHINKGSTLAVEGDLAIAEFDVQGRGTVQIEAMHAPGQQVVGRPLGEAATLRKLDWRLSPSGSGCQVDLDIEFRLGTALLKPANWQLLSPGRILSAFKSQCSAYASDGGSGDAMLDLMETPKGLILMYNGKRYVCHPEEEKA